MERELILCVKDKNYDREMVAIEIETMKRLLPYIESYLAFKESNDIFDIRDHRLITRSNVIRNVFKEGFGRTTKYYVFCKN